MAAIIIGGGSVASVLSNITDYINSSPYGLSHGIPLKGTTSKVVVSGGFAALMIPSGIAVPTLGGQVPPAGWPTDQLFPVLLFKLSSPGTPNTLPSSGIWQTITAGSSIFCAIRYGTNVCAASPDGISWTAGTMPVSSAWQAVAEKGGTFCAIAASASDHAATSTDGLAWSAQTLPTNANWNFIASNGTVFCAVAHSDTSGGVCTIAATSPDGATWTPRTLPASLFWDSIGAFGSKFCVTGYVTTWDNWQAAVSNDNGATWSIVDTGVNVSGSSISGMAWNGSAICAVTTDGRALTSPDGVTWATNSLPSNTYGAGGGGGISWNGSIFYVPGGNGAPSASSTNGTSWIPHDLPDTKTWLAVATKGGKFCLVPYNSAESLLIGVDGEYGTTIVVAQSDLDTINAALEGIPEFIFAPLELLTESGAPEFASPPTGHATLAGVTEFASPPVPFATEGAIVERTGVSASTVSGTIEMAGLPFETIGT